MEFASSLIHHSTNVFSSGGIKLPELLSKTRNMKSSLYFPKFPLPNGYERAVDYLKMLVLRGMERCYPKQETSKVIERIELEPCVIDMSGCADYILIIWDALQHARQQNILIGPGRGSAAGSIVNYCLGITQVDPLKHGLLFERFLTPNDYPWIDIDGDERLRDEMLCYLPKRYGKNHVAIVENDLCGIIISPIDVTKQFDTTSYVNSEGAELPMIKSKVSDVVEAGFLRFNFLSLDHLTIIRKTLENIKTQRNLDLDLSRISLDDADTLRLYREGQSDSTFIFSSKEIRENIRQLQSVTFNDLVALYNLYRPGTLDLILEYIARKHGEVAIAFPFAEMESILSETYGLMIYQEQLMLALQRLAGFFPNESNMLRKAFCKGNTVETARFKGQFITATTAKGYSYDIISRLWKDWENSGRHLFNKSHAVCYTLIDYQTTYLKAHFPVEYMAAYEQCKLSNKQ